MPRIVLQGRAGASSCIRPDSGEWSAHGWLEPFRSEEPPRFWAEKWAEFKRLLRLSWDESSARGTLALSAALIIVGCIMGVVDKLS